MSKKNGIFAFIGKVLPNGKAPPPSPPLEPFSKKSNLTAVIVTLLSRLLEWLSIQTCPGLMLPLPPHNYFCLVKRKTAIMTASAHVAIWAPCASLFELLSPPPLGGQTKAPWSDLEGENICQEEIELRVIQSFGDCSLATHTSTGVYHQDSKWRVEKKNPLEGLLSGRQRKENG